jgi:hypothetical protein
MTDQEISQLKLGLKLLSKDSLKALKDVANQASNTMTTIKLGYQANKLAIETALSPLSAKKDILDKLISDTRKSVQIIPPDVMAAFPELGTIVTAIEGVLLEPIEQAENILFEINRQYSALVQVAADISGVEVAISYFDNLVTIINQVLADM